MKAIDPDPEQRYASADEFARDLQRYLEHRTIHAVEPSRAERRRSSCSATAPA